MKNWFNSILFESSLDMISFRNILYFLFSINFFVIQLSINRDCQRALSVILWSNMTSPSSILLPWNLLVCGSAPVFPVYLNKSMTSVSDLTLVSGHSASATWIPLELPATRTNGNWLKSLSSFSIVFFSFF